ncbi:hypothetical protein LTR05_004900 [Lithohypha guttulata]|uniref:Bacteriophage T5 Orf172 DNA-binding domain-containing protein n=1 Tax=Lithohypha guttulata TaxID=1690604 RepID=A0AAN7SZ39_9EURO|nr:hypothetical protein LTR05_004900 [Lithohypha guttulata]
MRVFFKSCFKHHLRLSSTSDTLEGRLKYRELLSAQGNPQYVELTQRFRLDFRLPASDDSQRGRICSMLDDVTKRLSKDERGRGWIYWAKGKPNTQNELASNVLKVGFSKTEPATSRLRRIEKKCNIIFESYDQWQTDCALRVEALIHTELIIQGSQRIFRCGSRLCQEEHKEWFAIDGDRATSVVEYWIDWLEQYKPYSSTNGEFDTMRYNVYAPTLENNFLLNSIQVPWYRSAPNRPPQDDWCACDDKKNCTRKFNNNKEVSTVAPTRPSLEIMDNLAQEVAGMRLLEHPILTPPRARLRQVYDAHDDAFPETPPPLTPSTSANSVSTLSDSYGPPTPCAIDDLGVQTNAVRRTLFKKKADRDIPQIHVVDGDFDGTNPTSDIVPYDHDDGVMRHAKPTTVQPLPDKQEVRGYHLELPTRQTRRSSAPGNVEGYSINFIITDERAGETIEAFIRSPGQGPVRMSIGDHDIEISHTRRPSDTCGVKER